MALVINPANGATHKHTVPPTTAKVFQWSNTNPVVPNAANWRLKIGNAPFGFKYYTGTPVPFSQLEDDNVVLNPIPPTGARCYATVEWTTDGQNWSNGGSYTFFYCRP